jgi:hypothetical protein
MLNRSAHSVLALVLAFVAGVAGCRDSQPTALVSAPSSRHVTPSRDAGEDGAGTDNGEGAQLLSCAAHGQLSASAVVDAHGGVISVGDDHLVIPAGALQDSTLITATIPADTLADIHFAPHGLQFAKPAKLVLSTAGCNLAGRTPHHVVYLDSEGEVLQTLDATSAQNGSAVATQIGHFSSYAIAF